MGYKIVTAKNVHYICKYVTGYIKISIILAHSQMMIANNGFGVCFKKKTDVDSESTVRRFRYLQV